MALLKIPRLMIAGTHSGVGKTTVMVGLIQAFLRKGLRVQSFKSGPDYIDPGFHSAVSERPCRNLDSWLMPVSGLRSHFQRCSAGADLALIEGMMGLYDGIGALGEEGSTAQTAKRLDCPVLLVLDGSALSRSAAAMVRGFLEFDRRVKIAGVFLNRVSGPGHYRLLKEGIERLAKVPVVGGLNQEDRIRLPERHLGLVPSSEKRGWRAILPVLGEMVRRTVDLETIKRIAHQARPLAFNSKFAIRNSKLSAVPIGVAMDEAFHFYYPENLELLGQLGAELVPFSPLKDSRLPAGLAGFYLGGGFPEVYAASLSRAKEVHRGIRAAAAAGMPIYAECGGLMFLSRGIQGGKGRRYPMVGLVPAEIRMTDRLQSFGYKRLTALRATVLSRTGETGRGHEFHHSACRGVPMKGTAAYEAVSAAGNGRRLEGYAHRNLLASYVHLHFLSQPRWARRFVEAARNWQRRNKAR